MGSLATKLMTVSEFLAWQERQPNARFELVRGVPVAMAPERVGHAYAKVAAFNALAASIRRAEVGCHAVPDGATVRIGDICAYEPDALVYCGPRLSDDAVVVPDPVIVVEVISPSTATVDTGAKLIDYFRLPSVRHYLLIDPGQRVVVHHARGTRDVIETRIVREGEIAMDPPGLSVAVERFFAEP
jgi:Uma2 family endonuclease